MSTLTWEQGVGRSNPLFPTTFLKLWLKDIAAIEDARDDDHILEHPPDFN